MSAAWDPGWNPPSPTDTPLEKRLIVLHKHDEAIVEGCKLLIEVFHTGTEAEYEHVLANLRERMATRPIPK